MKSFHFVVLILLSFLHMALEGCDRGAAEERYLVGVHYYPWFDPAVAASWGECETALEPLLGYYDIGAKEVAEQHIEWARQYGVDVFGLVWWGRADGAGCIRPEEFCTRGERKLYSGFLQASNLDQTKFCIHYDVQNRLAEGWSFSYDFDDPVIYNTFVEDFVYFAENYFDHPSYFKIEGRPVVWLLFALFFQGDYASALLEARSHLKAMGYDVYIVGDVIWWDDTLNVEIVPYLDAVSSYNLYFPMTSGLTADNTADFAEMVRPLLEEWKDKTTRTKALGSGNYVDFQPGIIPRIWREWEEQRPLFALPLESQAGFTKMAEVARDLSEPALNTDSHIVWITSWNEWCERTSLEPTKGTEPDYPYGNLGFDLLEVIEEVYD